MQLEVPLAADRIGSRRGQMALVAGSVLAALLGLLAVPDAAVLWAILLGIGLGGIFPLCLTLPVDVAHRPAEVGAVAALMLLGGYLISGLGPVVLGLVRDATGSFAASLFLMAVLAAALVAACLTLTRERLGRGVGREWAAEPAVEAA